VNVAARLEQTAAAGDVVLGALTERLIRGHVTTEAVAPLTLKGKAEPVPAFRLVDVGDRRPRREPITTPMVGRDDELAALEEIATETVDERRCRVVTLVGDAGVGKSRLTEEFLAVVADGSGILRGRCLPYGDGITFWPVVELIRGAAAIRDEDPPEVARAKIAGLLAPGQADIADRLASLLGLAAVDYQVAELFWAIRRFLEIVAAERPLVVLFDDVHWAEDTFLDLVEHLAASVADAAVTLLCTARPDFLVEHADWLPAGLRIALEPLSDDAAARVVENLLGSVGLDREICDRVVAAAQGNPLFVEQLLSMLIDEGRLELVDGTWRAPGDLASFELPPSIDALIAARLDRLSTDERGVVDPASVIGQAFATDAVRALVDASLRDGVPSALDGLTERQLLTEAPEASELDYRFHHILVRDAAYRGLLKQTRAVLHERFVTWADEVNRERGREAEFEEILGYHLESAHRYWAELGPLDEHGRALGICASERLGSAGARAFARGDIPAAAGLLERAGDLLPEDHPELPGLRIQEGEAHFQEGDFARAEDRFAAAEHHARHGGRPALALAAHMERLRMGYATGAGLHSDDVAGEAREAIRELETLGDHGGLARAWRVLTSIEFTAERWGAAEESAREMLRHAAAAGNTTMELRVLPILALTALYGPTPVPEAIEMCEELLTRTRDDRRAGTFTLLPLARLLAMRGDFDEARSIYRRAWRTLSELGWAFQAALVSLDSGVIELQAGDPAAAEKELRRDYDAFAAMGETNYIATTAALLAEALYRLGRGDEAEELCTFVEENADPEDVASQFLWRGARAKLRAREGDHHAARELATEALRLTRSSDDVVAQANALVDCAQASALAGQTEAALEQLAEAEQLHAKKGNVVGAARARHLAALVAAGAEIPLVVT
jgi:tetratricopeptide (TPR) repeat protein